MTDLEKARIMINEADPGMLKLFEQRMDAVRMIEDYIIPNYEVLHSESRKNLTDSLIDTLKRWEEGV